MDKFWSIGPYDFEHHTDTGLLICTQRGVGVGVRNVPKENITAAKIAACQVALEAANTVKFRVYEFLKDLLAEGNG